ncbi:hypothetical protein BSL78_25078 [Apostichopus japonicus]|uniref:Uncharacterized protein n=1 Tax=Stichopus japonicus TaxID=307972 RepID=A0A2G8JQU7_STIJA|nr:hypothetical protein BSL78_25078 [Apostichopus japonicus]
MGIYWRGQVGVGHSQTRVQNRILLQPTFRGRRKADTHTHGPRQTLSPRRGNSGPAGQAGNYKSSGRDGTTLPVLLFSDQKTGRHLASHSKPKTPEHKTHQTKTLPYGDLKLNITPTQKGHVGGDRRLTGRLPAHLDTQEHRRFLAFRYAEQDYQFRALPFGLATAPRTFTRVAGAVVAYLKKGGHPLRISRRLVGSREQSIGSNQQRPQNAPDPSRTGLDREPEEITAITSQTIQFLGAILDFTTGVARPSEERVAAVKATTQQILAHRGSPTGTWLRALGLMASLVDIVRLCRLHMRPLQLHLLRSADPTDPDKTTLIYRGHPLRETVPTRVGGDNSGRGLRHDPTGFPHRRQAQRDGGRLSRGHIDPNEWSLEQETCDRIFSIFGRPTIDLFATHKNNKLQTFCSRRFHPLAYHTDAMSLSWDHMDAYIFPPLCMIGQVLRKIRNSKGRFTLIAPFWPRRPWFAEIPQLLMDVPVSLPDKPTYCPRDRELSPTQTSRGYN